MIPENFDTRINRSSQSPINTNAIRTPPKITNRNALVKYVEVDLWSWLKDLSTRLLKINFKDNFQSFTVENLTIPAGIEVSIPNQFRTFYPGNIPSGWIIVRQRLSGAVVIDGDTKWTDTHVYLKNTSVDDVEISVLFFK